MEKKTIGILICTLFIINGLAFATVNADDNQETIQKTLPSRWGPGLIVYFGIMRLIDSTTDTFDFKVTLFALIIDNGAGLILPEVHKPGIGTMIRVYDPAISSNGVIFKFGYCSSWEIIED